MRELRTGVGTGLLLPAMSHEPSLERSPVHAVQPFHHRSPQKGSVRDSQEVLGDEPHIFLRDHPLAIVESRQIHWPRERAERAIAAQVEVLLEVAQRKLAQRAVDRLAVPAARVIRLRDRTPMTADLEQRDDMVGVVLRLEIEEQRRETEHAERRRAEDRALEAVRRSLTEDASWRPRRRPEVVRHVVEESLNPVRSFERTQGPQLRGCES